jgi:replication factor C subunit 1
LGVSQKFNEFQDGPLQATLRAADLISDSDLVETQLRETNSWELALLHAVLSTIAPAYHVRGTINFALMFPS